MRSPIRPMLKIFIKGSKSIFITFGIICFIFTLIFKVFLSVNVKLKKNNSIFYVYPNYKVIDILKKLKTQGFIHNLFTIKIASKILGYKKVYSGAYCFRNSSNNLEIIQILKGGRQKPIKVVLHNIQDKSSLVEIFSNKLLLTDKEFITILNDDIFLKQYTVPSIQNNSKGNIKNNSLSGKLIYAKHKFTKENILCMFIPNTYEFYWNTPTKRVFQKMYLEYKKFWTNERLQKCKNMKLSSIEVSILASIVQAETTKKEEASIIAGVYYNRLRKKIRLQADPTLKFASNQSKVKRVLHIHKKVDSPYNTYKHRGLPPGPINVPTIFMIDAVLNYTKHDYLYMSAKEDFSGVHYFSKSYNNHVNMAIRYRRALNKLKIFK